MTEIAYTLQNLLFRTVSAALFHALNFGNDAPSRISDEMGNGNPKTRIRLRDLIACCAIFSTGEGFTWSRKKGRENSQSTVSTYDTGDSVAEDKLRLVFRAYGDNKDKTSTRVSKGKLFVTSKDVIRIMQVYHPIPIPYI